MTTTATPADLRPMKSLVRTGRDLALLVCRIGLGVLMIAHAKLEFDFGGGSLSGVGALFAQSGVSLPAITGPANVLLEAFGGVAIILGLAVSIVGVLMAVNMAGAWMFVHTSPLYSMDHNGPEVVIAIGLLSLALAAAGSGRFGIDHLITRRRRVAADAGQSAVNAGLRPGRRFQ